MPGQQYIDKTVLGRTEVDHHTVNWQKETDLTDDTIVDASFEFSSPALHIEWENFTVYDTTLCINANSAPVGKYYAHHNVVLGSGRKLRRTVMVRIVER